jgi:putative FmdB family regulatory protein
VPIYEYRCNDCNRKSAIFFKSISAAEQANSNINCPHCAGQDLRRLFSRFALGKSTTSEGEEIYEFDRMMAGLDTDDPRNVARWARKMGQESGMGEEMGPEFDEALDRIEDGEDPETVMTEIDPALGGEAKGID